MLKNNSLHCLFLAVWPSRLSTHYTQPPTNCCWATAHYLEVQKENPLHYLRVDARPCRLFKNEAQYYAIENNEGLVPWAGQQDNLIDRYDVRSLLDMYVEPDTR